MSVTAVRLKPCAILWHVLHAQSYVPTLDDLYQASRKVVRVAEYWAKII